MLARSLCRGEVRGSGGSCRLWRLAGGTASRLARLDSWMAGASRQGLSLRHEVEGERDWIAG